MTSEAPKEWPGSVHYTRDGHNIWPTLAWTDLPAGIEELALLFENIPPQTKAPFVQWLVYEISRDAGGLSEGCKHKADPRERSTWC